MVEGVCDLRQCWNLPPLILVFLCSNGRFKGRDPQAGRCCHGASPECALLDINTPTDRDGLKRCLCFLTFHQKRDQSGSFINTRVNCRKSLWSQSAEQQCVYAGRLDFSWLCSMKALNWREKWTIAWFQTLSLMLYLFALTLYSFTDG